MAVISFKSVGDTQDSEKFKSSRALDLPYGIKTPLSRGRGVIFKMTTDMRDQVHDNLKNLILTNSGERLGNFTIGANINSLLTENLASDSFDLRAMTKIKNSVKLYMPYVELKDFESKKGDIDPLTGTASVIIIITYNVNSIAISNKRLAVTILPVA